MRNTVSKRLRKLCVMSSFDPKTTRSRYQNLKTNWNRVPWKAKNNLYLVLLEKAMEAFKAREQRKTEEALDNATNPPTVVST